MVGLPRGFVQGLLVGAASAVGWRLATDRQTRMAVGERLLETAEAVPLLGPRVTVPVSAPFWAGIYLAVAEDVASEAAAGRLLEMSHDPGYLAVELGSRARDLEIATLDASTLMMQMAEHRVHSAGVGQQVKAVVGDARDVPYPDETFDYVLSVGGLSRWEAASWALGEIHRVLKPGGKVWLYDLRRDMPEHGWDVVREKLPALEQMAFDVAVVAHWWKAPTEQQIQEMAAGSPFGQAELAALTAEVAGTVAPCITRATLRK